MRIEFCSGCGAPLEARWSKIVLVCAYCGSQNAPGEEGEPVPSSFPDDGRLRLAVAGRTYLLLGLLARGDSSWVYKGRWVRRLGEEVVLKVLAAPTDEDLLRREWKILERLRTSRAPGTEHFVRQIPEPIGMARVEVGDRPRLTTVFKWRSGFFVTLEEVMRAHPGGVAPQAAVWIFKRLLELLSWVHRSGVVHSAVLPAHVLVQPRDHGASLVGWTVAAVRAGADAGRIAAVSRRWREWYPEKALGGRGGGPEVDVAMAARCALRAAGARRFDDAQALPPPLGELVVAAWALRERLAEASVAALGEPEYCPIDLPGWSSTAE